MQKTAERKTYRQNRLGTRKKRRRSAAGKAVLCLLCIVAAGIGAVSLFQAYLSGQSAEAAPDPVQTGREYEGRIPRPELDVELLTVNEYSRPAIPLEQVKGVVVHYTANPGTSAIANRNYFEGLKDSHITKASSHFIIGLEGEIVQCIPCSEMSYASNQRNQDTVSIECCIEDDTGKFNQATYDSLCHLTAWLVERYRLKTSDVIRHYDVTGKECPKYYVEFPQAWEQFLTDVQAYLDQYGV